MRQTVTCLVVLLALGCAGTATHAETLGMQTSQGKRIKVPERGMSMANVENIYGEPDRKFPAVGDPPITRWEYPDFIVYFEYDKVIHSVVTVGRPGPEGHQDP
ncbi:MAG: hypothetical protein PVJ40_10750 [Gammaproteobacteria bacterium]|jgi:hypothetical protein